MTDDLIQRPPLYKDHLYTKMAKVYVMTTSNDYLYTKTTSVQRPHSN